MYWNYVAICTKFWMRKKLTETLNVTRQPIPNTFSGLQVEHHPTWAWPFSSSCSYWTDAKTKWLLDGWSSNSNIQLCWEWVGSSRPRVSICAKSIKGVEPYCVPTSPQGFISRKKKSNDMLLLIILTLLVLLFLLSSSLLLYRLNGMALSWLCLDSFKPLGWHQQGRTVWDSLFYQEECSRRRAENQTASFLSVNPATPVPRPPEKGERCTEPR